MPSLRTIGPNGYTIYEDAETIGGVRHVHWPKVKNPISPAMRRVGESWTRSRN